MFAALGVFFVIDHSAGAAYLAFFFAAALTTVFAVWFRELAHGPYEQVTGIITSKPKKGPKDAWDDTVEEWFIRMNRRQFRVGRDVYDALSKGDRITVSVHNFWRGSIGAIVRHERADIS